MTKTRFITVLALLASSLIFSSAQAKGDPARGKVLAYTCTGCHGIPFYMNAYPSYHVPRLGNQNAPYIVAALTEYKQAKRSHKTMQAQAWSLTTQDMEDIAAWIASLKGEVNKTERFPEEVLAKGKKIVETVLPERRSPEPRHGELCQALERRRYSQCGCVLCQPERKRPHRPAHQIVLLVRPEAMRL